MQRGNYPPNTAASPPLHHPVPQHHVPIPVMHSPPPLQASSAYGNTYAPTPAMGHPAYGFLNDPTTQMAFQVGGRATEVAGQYVEQNLGKYLQVSALKHYFNVSNGYVLQKLGLVLFPWRHKPWSRSGSQRTSASGQMEGYFLPPREDINSPDMYIPVMAFVTYILLSTLLYGLAGRFNPEQLGYTASFAFTIVILEIIIIKIGCYLLNIDNDSQLLDLVAYSGYKFVGIIVTLTITTLGSKWLEYLVFGYAFNANAFFLLRSLKYVLLPDTTADNPRSTTYAVNRTQRNRRTQFLFLYSYLVQLIFMWSLSSGFSFRSAAT
ncbi:unnamed protein product [Tuber aestivum]|uniref:Protein YIF1 n=1 Tax=Tuber aestivum TaxID=59557 RepID=A0A292PSC8_9PEZI|nr:unnamed protein product [Tuber aestivum]